MQYGLDLAAEEKVPMTLESTPHGRFLYLSMGFKVVEVLRVVEDLQEGYVMVWEPEELKGTWLEETGDGVAKFKRSKRRG